MACNNHLKLLPTLCATTGRGGDIWGWGSGISGISAFLCSEKDFSPGNRENNGALAVVALCFFSKWGMPDGTKPCIIVYRSRGMKTSLEKCMVITKSARACTSTFDGSSCRQSLHELQVLLEAHLTGGLEGKANTNCR